MFSREATVGTTPIETLEGVFKALADATRLRILALLAGGEVCVCHIHDTLGVPQPTASRHLAYLRRLGLVEVRREGVWMHYRISTALDPVVQGIIDATVHALTHVPAALRDRKQFRKVFGEPAPPPSARGAGRGCCAVSR